MPESQPHKANSTTETGIPLLEHLTADQLAVVAMLADAFAAENAELYLVGGPVRDLLLDRPVPNDLDFATSIPPKQTREIANRLPHVGLYDVGEKFGTIGIVMPA